MSNETQNYANHGKTPTSLIVYCILLLASTLLATVGLVMALRGSDSGLLLVAGAVILQGLTTIGGLTMARFYSLTLQDRIIRLEMRLRLERILPEHLHGEIAQLPLSHLIALRFAADEEVTELFEQTLREKPAKGAWIKSKIKDWQPDHLRV